MEICLMRQGHPLWEKTISFAQSCSWRAGPVLAERMKKNAFLDWERVIAAAEGGAVAGYCAFSEKDGLPDGSGYGPFISFVFVDEKNRGRRLSERMIREALRYAKALGFETVYLLSGEKGLYEKYGFHRIGDAETVYGTADGLFVIRT